MEKKSKQTLIMIAAVIIGSFLLMTFLGTFKKELQKKPKKIEKRFYSIRWHCNDHSIPCLCADQS